MKPPLADLGGFAFAILGEDNQLKQQQGGEALLECDANLSIDKLRLTASISRWAALRRLPSVHDLICKRNEPRFRRATARSLP